MRQMSKARSRERGTSILVVLSITLLVTGVVSLILVASSTLNKQSAANLESASSRNQARSGVNLVAAYLDQRLNAMNAPLPASPFVANANEWIKDGSNVYYMVLYGRAGNGTPTTTLDSARTYGAGNGTGSATRTTWLNNARTLIRSRPANITYISRVEIVGDTTSSTGYYYHCDAVAATDDMHARSSSVPVVLVSQAALVPYKRAPFGIGGMTGLQGVVLKGSGTLGTLNGSSSAPFITTNKNVTKTP